MTLGKEMYLDLKDRGLAQAEEQRRLFAENLTCLQQEFQRFQTDDGLIIDAVICDQTAAIILRLMADDDRHRVIAIDVPGLFEVEAAQALSLVAPAYADPVTDLRFVQALDPDTEVICVAQTDPRTITRHIKLRSQCYDEPLDMLTGWVGAAVPVPCRTTCVVDQ